MTIRNYRPDDTKIGTRKSRGEYLEEKFYPYWIPSTKIRLFRRVPGICFYDSVHELVEHSIKQKGLRIGDLDVPVLHFGDMEKERDTTRYLRIAEDKVKHYPLNPKALFELAINQSNAEKFSEALISINKALELTSQGQKDEYFDLSLAYALKGNVLRKLGNYQEAIEVYKMALELTPSLHEVANNIGVCYENQGDFHSAEQWLRQAIAICPDAELSHTNLQRVQRKKRKERTLSICMIVRNEAKRIQKAIRSVLPFADEVVVVDTGSEDDTVEIARQLGAKIGYFEWCNDFSAARNASLDLATGDWIMWLDADDYIPATEWPKLQEVKLLPPNQAFMFKLQNEGPSNEISLQLRMFPNRPEVRFRYPVHEQVAPALRELGLPLRWVDITVVHTGYHSIEVIREKKKKYLKLLRERVIADPSDLVGRFHIAFIYHSTGKYSKAAREFEILADDSNFAQKEPEKFFSTLIHLGRAYLQLDRIRDALEVFKKAAEIDYGSRLLIVSLAECYNRLDEPEKALSVLENMKGEIPISTIPVNLEALKYAAEYQRALALYKMGNLEEALYACRRAENISRIFGEAHTLANKILSKLSKDTKSISTLQKVSHSELACSDDIYEYGNALVRLGRVKDAEEMYFRALSKDESHIRARRALAFILRRNSQFKEAQSILEQGLAIDPESPDLLSDLLDLLFEQENWEKILDMNYTEQTLATRLAARILSGLHEGIEEEVLLLFKSYNRDLGELDKFGITAIWNLAKHLQNPQAFHLAVACFWANPSMLEAADKAVHGFLERGRTDKALQIAEKYVSSAPTDPQGFVLLAWCYETLGAMEAVAACYKQMKRMRQAAQAHC
ncbi:MAG TPA: tetratricopeptide repeat protein [Chromatiaceae bacterium]|nr:tetratricopeptide repeat protein [Chromatiaceae bacterium]